MKMYVLYDSRARTGDPDKASVLDTARSEDQCRRRVKFGGAVWFEYDKERDGELINPRIREDL
jgi:hypothetical protein